MPARFTVSRVAVAAWKHPSEALTDLGLLLRFVALATFGAAGALLPISAAIREARRPRDDSPLAIDRDYRQEDRFFALSFEKRLNGLLGPPPRTAGLRAVQMHQKETVESVCGSLTLQRSGNTILDVDGDLHVNSGLTLEKEIRITGTAHIAEGVTLRALKADRDVFLAPHVTVQRWVDAGRHLVIFEETSSGERATAIEEIFVSQGVRFHVLAAPLIRFGERQRKDVLPKSAAEGRPAAEFADVQRWRIRADGALLIDGDFVLPDGAVALGDVVARGTVKIGINALIIGSLHSDTTILLEPESTVSGSVFAEDSLTIGPAAVVTEHALTRGVGRVLEDVRIGTVGRVTTLMARRGLEIAAGTRVHGRVVAAGGGITV